MFEGIIFYGFALKSSFFFGLRNEILRFGTVSTCALETLAFVWNPPLIFCPAVKPPAFIQIWHILEEIRCMYAIMLWICNYIVKKLLCEFRDTREHMKSASLPSSLPRLYLRLHLSHYIFWKAIRWQYVFVIQCYIIVSARTLFICVSLAEKTVVTAPSPEFYKN